MVFVLNVHKFVAHLNYNTDLHLKRTAKNLAKDSAARNQRT